MWFYQLWTYMCFWKIGNVLWIEKRIFQMCQKQRSFTKITADLVPSVYLLCLYCLHFSDFFKISKPSLIVNFLSIDLLQQGFWYWIPFVCGTIELVLVSFKSEIENTMVPQFSVTNSVTVSSWKFWQLRLDCFFRKRINRTR